MNNTQKTIDKAMNAAVQNAVYCGTSMNASERNNVDALIYNGVSRAAGGAVNEAVEETVLRANVFDQATINYVINLL